MKVPPPDCAGNTKDENGCSTLGQPLEWPHRCSWFGVQQDASAKRGITYDTFHATVKRAFEKWASVDCGGGQHPSFEMTDADELYGPAACSAAEFDKDTPNASIWMFSDQKWTNGDPTTTLAVTLLHADISNGKIYDADVLLNSFAMNITVSDDSVRSDLEGIVTHEAGHYLGLAHSKVIGSTMYEFYSARSVAIRDLSPDDVAGICAVYPPSEGAPTCNEPEPLFGYSRYCGGASPSTLPAPPEAASSGCTVGTPARSAGGGVTGPLLALLGGLVARRRAFVRVRRGRRWDRTHPDPECSGRCLQAAVK